MYTLSQKPVGLERIHDMLIGSEEVWHYSFSKRLSALLYDETKHIEEESITVCAACCALQLKNIWKCMKRFAEASTAGQGEQKCQKKVKICFISKTTTPSA